MMKTRNLMVKKPNYIVCDRALGNEFVEREREYLCYFHKEGLFNQDYMGKAMKISTSGNLSVINQTDNDINEETILIGTMNDKDEMRCSLSKNALNCVL